MGNILMAILILGLLGAVFGLVLAAASRFFRVEKDPREEAILRELAGMNCGACGYPGCAGCAAAILAGKAPVTACIPAGKERAAEIARIMGQSPPPEAERQVAFVRCQGGEAAVRRYQYRGIRDCTAAVQVGGGPLACEQGCLGLGSCVAVCEFGALSLGANGAAVVDPERCVGCRACVDVCPRHLIQLVPAAAKVHVACRNAERGKAAMEVCAVSCIGCGACERNCPKGAIQVQGNVAAIDPALCIGCRICTKVCPRDAIVPPATAEEKAAYREVLARKAEEAKRKAAAQEQEAPAKQEPAQTAPDPSAPKQGEKKNAGKKGKKKGKKKKHR